ncbi:hypothetical protein SAMN05421827_10997 [Pedobacter terrae]|uniref:Uncharacterized protein n=1 Tax=Pedobacter terrae TaxID=405671 RepID=A0A1G7W4N0_9SPHI|nr:HTH-type transcriptional repressor FabR [Pedobacter terrae]SDG66883.1 hypothetical protein SAMN05421827_10997 [Pedobacter terrae]
MKKYNALFCNKLIDRGKILEKVVQDMGISIAEVARKTNYERTTVYRHFSKSDLDYAIILKYGKALKYDFSVQFPELLDFTSQYDAPLSDYKVITVADALKERDYWKDKYVALLERHNELLYRELGMKSK